MRISHRIVVSIASLLASLPAGAWAACNQIPSADELRVHAITEGLLVPDAEATRIAAELQRRSGKGALPFKGALGRASRALVVPDANAGIAVAPDSICVAGGRLAAASAPAGKNDLVAVIIHPTWTPSAGDGLPAYAQIFASDTLCDAIEEELSATGTASHTPPAFGENVRLLGKCSNDGVEFRTASAGDGVPYVLALPVPPLPRGDAAVLSANVRIAVFRASTAADVRQRVNRLASPALKCESVCSNPDLAAGLDVCIDDLYETLLGATPGAQALFVKDSIGCNIAIPPDIQCNANDFKDLCDSPNVPKLARCAHSASDVQLWQSNCGSVHFPFTYAGIRQDTAGATDVDRILQGTTGMARKKNGDPVYLPGKEFVGATLCVQQCDDPPCSSAGDWRLPDLDVWYKDGSNAVAGLRGVADKDTSVVAVVPALKAVLLCDVLGSDEACTGVDYENGTRGVVCACRDRHPANCKCKDASPPRYFECAAAAGHTGTYIYAGLPCTRHNHCPEGGYCNASPKCRPSGQRVWGDSGQSGSDCQADSVCAGGQVCGFRLFDFSYLIDDPQKPAVGKFHEKVTGSGGTVDRRGYCKNDVKKGCKRNADCGNQTCLGYDLEAGDKPQPQP